MLKANDIQSAVFQTQMGGYKRDEVDQLLNQIVDDYKQFESVISSQQTKIAGLEKELAEKEVSMNSINTVLISAQKLADDIVAEAKVKADETVENANIEAENIKIRTKKALEEIDAVLTQQKSDAQAQVDSMLEDAARKTEGMILAAKDSVTREQLLFDKLKSEVADFKRQIKEAYKSHIESISKLPEEVVLSPELAASTIEEIINKEPDLMRFIEKTPVANAMVEEIIETQETAQEQEVEISEEIQEEVKVFEIKEAEEEEADDQEDETPASTGFVVQAMDDDDLDDAEEGPNFSSGFFAKHK